MRTTTVSDNVGRAGLEVPRAVGLRTSSAGVDEATGSWRARTMLPMESSRISCVRTATAAGTLEGLRLAAKLASARVAIFAASAVVLRRPRPIAIG
jgi:hypothetical protein